MCDRKGALQMQYHRGRRGKPRVFMGDFIIRKVDTILNRGDDIALRLPTKVQCREGENVGHRWQVQEFDQDT